MYDNYRLFLPLELVWLNDFEGYVCSRSKFHDREASFN